MRGSHRITMMFAAATLYLAPLATPLAAQTPRATEPLVITAENRTAAAEAARGAPRGDTKVRGGDVVRYRLAFTNTAGRAIRDVVLSDPIPAEMRFVAGSARIERTDARLEFSADGGKSWSAEPTETVVVDGRAVTRPVPAERYTNVRWTVAGPLAPAATVVAEFDARMPAPAAPETK